MSEITLDARIPDGPIAEKWDQHKFDVKLVNPANKRKFNIIVVGSWLAGASAAATLGELGYRALVECRRNRPGERCLRCALTPLEVYDMARKKYRALGLVTVYRTLEKLEELHLIQRVHQPMGCQAFISAGHGHQHLLLCQNCG
jgi:hypothetical protein